MEEERKQVMKEKEEMEQKYAEADQALAEVRRKTDHSQSLLTFQPV